jgi:exosome complex component CSL4
MFRAGDIVRAKVIGVQREPIQLSTVGRDLGVLVALCSRCRTVLNREGNRLRCPECGSLESRKLTNDYRQGVL